MEITGHKTESVYRRYDIVDDRDLKAAGAKMETYFRQPASGSLGTVLGTVKAKAN